MVLETLFLDAGGVVMCPDWEWVAAAFARLGLAVTAEALAGAEPFVKRDLDTPESIRASDDAARARLYFLGILERAGVRADRPLLDQAWAAIQERHARANIWSSIPPGVPEALKRLRAAGLDLVIVSNANGTLVAHLQRIGLLDHFSEVIDSQVVGVEKPDPRIFEIALERSGARRETTVHVGDIYEIDVVGARAAGLGAVLIDPSDLYAERDCRRFSSLPTLTDAVVSGAFGLEPSPLLR